MNNEIHKLIELACLNNRSFTLTLSRFSIIYISLAIKSQNWWKFVFSHFLHIRICNIITELSLNFKKLGSILLRWWLLMIKIAYMKNFSRMTYITYFCVSIIAEVTALVWIYFIFCVPFNFWVPCTNDSVCYFIHCMYFTLQFRSFESEQDESDPMWSVARLSYTFEKYYFFLISLRMGD